ncbi:rhomboid family intramembrane serine protease [Tenacibaculum piscium]|uniref:Rhomboid family intramembrane serine protease n=1 Tax=Tenacibaculum piscium TaxID=1458515 RepID=A0A2H1YFB1_9FLAO|nr:rhomboid family intramembrane serine protease [Tenacibaculum piscium]MBE7629004.1 rhomboid family intramembrane serine protease [Tenacibaculum piscium]MBE7670448.1 rhomboid family intramembrane serine protease [Tenacibaculum piscium]MBE7684975.1 rhomboid family intramembrane serine protease [Tenacibaculum piscium]MBE7689678.1 rhomboid family intramembrane serine protease [Tenacibaculum piscium]SOS74165.1 Rhomboid family intramembrane serine protease [Tenacibaculum piscium]
MKTATQLKYSNRIFLLPFIFVFSIWIIYWIEITFGFNFNKFGILPRELSGLKGILMSPFIHGDTGHLFNNSVPLFVLSASLFYFYREVALKILIFGGLFTGFLTWSIARESYHIGASGVVYLLFSFVFFSGIIKKQYRLVAVSLIMIFLYGSMIWYVLPIKDGISWEGHLSGFITGILLAIFYRKKGVIKEKFVFSKTAFDELFDENGNYVPPVIQEEIISEEDTEKEKEEKEDKKIEINISEEKKEIEKSSELNYKYIYTENNHKS